jgi:hypothetical protein
MVQVHSPELETDIASAPEHTDDEVVGRTNPVRTFAELQRELELSFLLAQVAAPAVVVKVVG